MRDDFVPPRDNVSDDLRVTLGNRAVGRDACLHSRFGERIEQPVEPDPRAILPGSIMAVIRERRLHMARCAKRRVAGRNRKPFEADANPDRDRFATGPCHRLAGVDRGPVIEIMIVTLAAFWVFKIGGV